MLCKLMSPNASLVIYSKINKNASLVLLPCNREHKMVSITKSRRPVALCDNLIIDHVN